MTEIQKTYTGILNDIAGKDWKTNDTWRVGSAGVAVAVSILGSGESKLKNITELVPDFSQTEVRTALMRLKKNGYVSSTEDGKYVLSVGRDESIADTLFWALLINVANGYMGRS